MSVGPPKITKELQNFRKPSKPSKRDFYDVMHYASCIMHHSSYIMYHASCIMKTFLKLSIGKSFSIVETIKEALAECRSFFDGVVIFIAIDYMENFKHPFEEKLEFYQFFLSSLLVVWRWGHSLTACNTSPPATLTAQFI